MPFRKPMLTLAVSDAEESEDESEVVAGSTSNSLSSSGGTFKKMKSESPNGLDGQLQALALNRARAGDDSHEEDASQSGGKRGRGALKRQDSFEVTETMTFKQDGVNLKPDGMRDARAQQLSNVSYADLVRERVLGRGATSKVFLMRHATTGRLLAVKELTAMADDDTRRMAVNELRIAHRHAHAQHLVNFVDAFFADGKICIAMEFMDAGSFEGIIKASHSGLSHAGLGAITVQYLQGLQYLHREMHQVHRDLKPANVMVTRSGVAKLSDFGISKQLADTQAFAMTQCGTSMYMSPERFRGEMYTYTADTWAAGVMTLEGLTAHHPYEHAKTFMSLSMAICSAPSPTAPEGTPIEIGHFVEAALRKEPEGKGGRPAIRVLVQGTWMQQQHLRDPAAETRAYLEEMSI